jgi:hypothetical protein
MRNYFCATIIIGAVILLPKFIVAQNNPATLKPSLKFNELPTEFNFVVTE